MAKPPRITLRRAVTRSEFIPNREGSYTGQWALFLDCGHMVMRNGRIPVPKQTRCSECKRATLNPDESSDSGEE